MFVRVSCYYVVLYREKSISTICFKSALTTSSSRCVGYSPTVYAFGFLAKKKMKTRLRDCTMEIFAIDLSALEPAEAL